MRILSGLLILALATSLPLQASQGTGSEYSGKVNHVFDGSTIRVAYKGGQIRVKLAAMEAPFAPRARQTLAQQVLGKDVKIEELRWQQGYLVGRVLVDGKGICTELVRQGHARVSEEFADLPGLRQSEDEARHARRGIWAREPEASS